MAKNKARVLKPGEVGKKKREKREEFPDAVFEAFNELIVEDFDGESATVLQCDLVALMKKKGLKEKAIYDNDWLEVEDVYRAAGWKVRYESMAWESGEPNFTFSKK